MLRYLKLMLIGVLLLLAIAPVAQAQEGLSADQLALLDRAFAAIVASEANTSYVAITTESRSSSLTISGGGIEQSRQTDAEIAETVTWNTVDGQTNIGSVLTLDYSDTVNGQGITYTLQAELRFVNNELYIRGQYLSSEGEVIELPADWVTLEEALSIEPFDVLQLEDRAADARNEPSYDPLLTEPDVVKSLVNAVSSEQTTLSDGRTVELITFTLQGDDVVTLLQRDPEFDPTSLESAVSLQLDPESIITVQIYLDETGALVRRTVEQQLLASDIDLHALDPEGVPEGVLGTVGSQILQDDLLTQINAPLEPAIVPEGFGS